MNLHIHAIYPSPFQQALTKLKIHEIGRKHLDFEVLNHLYRLLFISFRLLRVYLLQSRTFELLRVLRIENHVFRIARISRLMREGFCQLHAIGEGKIEGIERRDLETIGHKDVVERGVFADRFDSLQSR